MEVLALWQLYVPQAIRITALAPATGTTLETYGWVSMNPWTTDFTFDPIGSVELLVLSGARVYTPY